MKIRCIVLNFFKLILKIYFKLIIDVDDESLRVFNIFLEQNLEVRSFNRSDTLMIVFMLGLSKDNDIIKILDANVI